MSLLMVAKDKDSSKWYIVSQGCVSTDYGLKRYESQRRYRIQKTIFRLLIFNVLQIAR